MGRRNKHNGHHRRRPVKVDEGYFLNKAEQVLAHMPAQTYNLNGLIEVLKQDAGMDAVRWPGEHDVSSLLHDAVRRKQIDGSRIDAYRG